MLQNAFGSMPGFSAVVESVEWAGFLNEVGYQPRYLVETVTFDSLAVDAGNTPTTTLRGGLVVAKKNADGNYYAYDPDATDGTQRACGVLPVALNMLGASGTVEDKSMVAILRAANLQSAACINLDLQAKAQLIAQGFRFDTTAPDGAAALGHPIGIEEVAEAGHATTLTAADNGKLIIANDGANAYGITLPTLSDDLVGFKVKVLNAGTAALTVTAEANTIIYGDAGGALSTTIAWSTANKIMGGGGIFTCINLGGTPRWWFENTGTAATSA